MKFITPPNHVHFKAKKLFGEMENIINGSIAYMDANCGGPLENHAHEHDHLFIVTKGEAKILLKSEGVILKKDESYLVDGNIHHSVWNNIDGETVMIGIRGWDTNSLIFKFFLLIFHLILYTMKYNLLL